MQLMYRVFTLACTVHPAFCVLLLSLGFQPTVRTLVVVHPDAAECTHTTNETGSVRGPYLDEYAWGLSSFYFLACACSSAFAMVYLFAMEENTITGHVAADDPGTLDYARGADLLFWCFLLDCTCVSLSLPTRPPPPIDQLYLRCALHFGALFMLCAPRERAWHELSLSIALLLFLASSFFATTGVACSQVALVLSLMHRFLELVLVLAHRWEAQPPQATVYNARLFFIAFAGLLLHLDAGLLRP
jgi:hypothetical protein